MKNWTENFENHGVHNILSSTAYLLKEIESEDHDDPEIVEGISRIKQIINQLHVIIEKLDPVLVRMNVIDTINTIITNVNNDLTNFKNDRNKEHIIQANNRCDNLLAQFSQLYIPFDIQDFKGIRASITSFRMSVAQFMRSIKNDETKHREEIKTINNKLSELVSTIDSQKGRLDNAISQFQEQFSRTEENRRDTFNESEKIRTDQNAEAIEKRKEEMLKMTHEFQNNIKVFMEELEKRKEEFKNEILTDTEQLKSNNESIISELNKKNDEHMDQLLEKTKMLLAKLEEYKKQAENLVHVISLTGMVGGYQKHANEERRVARVWQILSVLAFAGLIIFAIFAFKATLNVDFKWSLFAGRVFVASTFGLLGAYAARQADRREEVERKNRKMELEIASIDPFLVELPESDKFRIKEELAKKLFGKEEPAKIKEKDKVSGNMIDSMKQLIDMFQTLIKKYPPG